MKEVVMPKVSCPACRKKISLPLSELILGNRLHCPLCYALLEVVEEDPPKLMEVEEYEGPFEIEGGEREW